MFLILGEREGRRGGRSRGDGKGGGMREELRKCRLYKYAFEVLRFGGFMVESDSDYM